MFFANTWPGIRAKNIVAWQPGAYNLSAMMSISHPDGILETCRQVYGAVSSFLDYHTPFQLLISVILSAQTTDAQVNRCSPELFRQCPDAFAMAQAEIGLLESLVKSTGYYRVKARHISNAARHLVSVHAGEVPQTMEELVGIPGVGRKSAGVILHHIFNQPAIIVDTHFARVSRRLGFTVSEDPLLVERDVAGLFPVEAWGELSMLLNLHGRRVCHARKPQCSECCLVDRCPSTIVGS